MPKYDGTEGQLIPARDAKVLTTRHQNFREQIVKDGRNYVEAEFFGLETFKKLLDQCEGEPVGFRVYYGLRDEDHNGEKPIVSADGKGKATSRLFIVPVDADGTDLSGIVHVGSFKDLPAQGGGHKDMPSQGQVMVGGPICPRLC